MSSSDEEDEQDWGDWGDDSGEESTKSLFSDTILASAQQAIEFDAREHEFDLRRFRAENELTDYDTIRCINFIRAEVAEGRSPLHFLLGDRASTDRPWEKDQYMRPVLLEDPLLFHDFDQDMAEEPHSPAGPSSSAVHTTDTQMQALQDENLALKCTLQELSRLALPSELAAEQPSQSADGAEDDWLTQWQATAGSFGVQAQRNEMSTSQPDTSRDKSAHERINDAYFDSYGFFGIHRDMISDKVRTDAYRDALQKNPALLQGASVLDVGCGTGILSMFAAQAGASNVIGGLQLCGHVCVDGSERIAAVAQRLVRANGLSESLKGPVTIVQGQVEKLTGLPLKQVDVIVSEWMGYALLFESMLDTVLYARDRWLKPGGAILPDMASIHLAAASAEATGLTFWDKVYGFDFSLVRQELQENAHSSAILKDVSSQHILSNSYQLRELDIARMSAAETSFTTDFVLDADPQRCGKAQECHALVLWFDTDFSQRFCKQRAVKLSTSPHSQQTHWCQTVLVLRRPILLGFDQADSNVAKAITGRFSMARSNQHRGIDMSVEYSARYQDGSVGPKETQIFSMTMSS